MTGTALMTGLTIRISGVGSGASGQAGAFAERAVAMRVPGQTLPPDYGPGQVLGDAVGSFVGSTFDQLAKWVWAGGQALLRASFVLGDYFTDFLPTDASGSPAAGSPLGAVWPTLKWVATVVAIGLFFVQMTLTATRGGRGLFRTVTGPLQYGIALALTIGGASALLAGADGLTTFLLQQGLGADTFVAVMDLPAVSQRMGAAPDLSDIADESVRSVVLAVVAIIGVIPAALSFAFQMVFREGAFLVLAATVPITAAGLLSDATAAWFWRALRWMLVAIVIKPALALVLVIGVSMLSATSGLSGLIVGILVLLVSVFAPMTLYRLLAFVDPGTGPGQAIRTPSLRNWSESQGDDGASEATNYARFNDGEAQGGGTTGTTGVAGRAPTGGAGTASPAATGTPGGGTAAGGTAGGGAAGGGAAGGGAAGGAAAGGAAGGAVAAVMLVKEAGQAANRWASNQLSTYGIGHPGGTHGGGASRGASFGAAPGGSDVGPGGEPVSDGGGDVPPVPEESLWDDRDTDPRGWPAIAPATAQPPPDTAPGPQDRPEGRDTQGGGSGDTREV